MITRVWTPTLYEHFTGQAATDLRPESSRNIETGLHFEQGNNKLSAVVYQNKVRDQITYDWTSAMPATATVTGSVWISRA